MVGFDYEIGSDTLTAVTINKLFDMAELDQEQRDMLYLRYVMEWSHRKIGEHIGHMYEGRAVAESTIRYRMENIHEKLRNIAQLDDFL